MQARFAYDNRTAASNEDNGANPLGVSRRNRLVSTAPGPRPPLSMRSPAGDRTPTPVCAKRRQWSRTRRGSGDARRRKATRGFGFGDVMEAALSGAIEGTALPGRWGCRGSAGQGAGGASAGPHTQCGASRKRRADE
jgi:hypothetical protein